MHSTSDKRSGQNSFVKNLGKQPRENHFHLLLRTPRANLSRFMQRLNTSYALYARYKHRKPGHQFEARFKAKLVQDHNYLLAATRYIHLNPIKTAACRRMTKAQRLRRLAAHRGSSFPGYVAKRNAEEFVCYDVLKQYGSTMAAARRRYGGYVRACVLEDDHLMVDAMRGDEIAIGDETFAEQMKKHLQRRRTGGPRDKDVALPAETFDIEMIDTQVARRYGIEPSDLFEHGHRVGEAKFVAVELASRLTNKTGRAVGHHYGGISSAAVSIIRRKIRHGDYDVSATITKLTRAIRKQTG